MSHSSRQEVTAADELLTIGQVSERTGVARSALHYYEQLGLVGSLRTAGNQRRYPRHMIRRITLISVGRNLGIALEDIARALEPVPLDRRPSEADWQRASQAWVKILEQRRRAIEELETRLTGCIGCGCLSMQACQLLNPQDELATEGVGPRRLAAQEPGVCD